MITQKLLVEHGFLTDEGKELFADYKTIEERKKFLKESGIDAKEFAGIEKRELHVGRSVFTGYPKSVASHRLIYENYSMSIEEMYYWVLTQLTVDQGFRKEEVIKITDIFSASEMSSYWGISAQRISIQQDRVSQYLKFIADMIKTMFQLIRDLNIVDEKLEYYKKSFSDDDNVAQEGEVVLKGQFADLVEGGPKNPSSIFGMAQQLGFATLPNLFFQTRIKGVKDEEIRGNINKTVSSMEFGNDTFKTVLIRKLTHFYTWKFRTYKQLNTYRGLYKSYLKQHYNNIRLYMNWVKPYLRNIRKLSPDGRKADSAELISAFEGEMTEIEILAQKGYGGEYNAVVLANFDYRTMPQMEWVPGHNERRAVMTGRAEMNLKAYVWTKEDIKNYVKMKEAEDLELIKEIDSTIHESMNALEDDIKRFLNEDENKKDEKDKKEKTEKKWKIEKGKIVEVEEHGSSNFSLRSTADPFINVFKGFGELLKPFSFKIPVFGRAVKTDESMKKAKKDAVNAAWNTYKFYKKAHGLLSW
jgi:hypothetical protein